MKPTIFANQGTTAEHNTAIENAIHQGYSAIALGCAYDPTTNARRSPAAQKAGLTVLGLRRTQAQAQQVNVQYNNVDPYALDATLAVDQAVSQHNGQPVRASLSPRTRRRPPRPWKRRSRPSSPRPARSAP